MGAATAPRLQRLQPRTLPRRTDVAELTAGYGLVVADECHHVPAAAFTDAVRKIPARRWLGLTATPYRRDKLDDLIAWQVGETRHNISPLRDHDRDAGPQKLDLPGLAARPVPVLLLHQTGYSHDGDADPRAPGGMAVIYRDLANDDGRNRQITADVSALARGRHCLVLTQWVAHLRKLAEDLQQAGHDPVILRGGMGARSRDAAIARLTPPPGGPPLLVVATGPYAGEGFDCPALGTLFLAARSNGTASSSGTPGGSCALPRQGNSGGPRLSRRRHRRPGRHPGRPYPRLHQPGLS
jgi:hypothetical protein